MTTERNREADFTTLNNEELKSLYQIINTRLAKGLLSGTPLQKQEQNIFLLNEISDELNRRKGFSGPVHSSEEIIRS